MKNLYVVTHAQSQHHIDRVVGGWYDSPLTELGRRQAASIGRRLRELVPKGDAVEIHSSDLKRAHGTAEAISAALGVPVRTTPDLREMSQGEAEGQPQAWLLERYVYPTPDEDRMDHTPGFHGAESRRQVATRIDRAVDAILAGDSEHQVIVTHGFALTFVVAAWIRMPLDAAGYLTIRSTSGGITRLAEDDVWRNRVIERLNDTAHLAGVEA